VNERVRVMNEKKRREKKRKEKKRGWEEVEK
jgi:hypothetical protein